MPVQQFIDDQTLVHNYIKGDESALENLINRHKRKIFAYIRQTVKEKEAAQDIFQDTFFKVVRTLKQGRYNEKGKFLPWVMSIAHNLIMDSFRIDKRMPTMSSVKNADGKRIDIFSVLPFQEKVRDHEQIISQKELRKDIRVLIEQLSPEQREVLMMRHYYDMSFKEIAEQTNVSMNTALGRMRYALLNMRKLIEENELMISTR